MNLPSLPDLVVERIIHHAALKDVTALKTEKWNNYKLEFNIIFQRLTGMENMCIEKTWMMILHKYGQVSRHWRSVILQSSKLFDTDEKGLMEIKHDMDNEGYQLRQMIKEGYMERASKITLNLYRQMRNEMETLITIRNAAATRNNSIKIFEFFADEEFAYQGSRKTRSMIRKSLEHWDCFMDILRLSENCETVVISIGWILHQRDAKVFCDCLLALLKIKTIKNIEFDTGLDFCHTPKRIQGRTFLVSDRHINWDFIKRRAFGNEKIDHIKRILISKTVPEVGWYEKGWPNGCRTYNFDFIYDRSGALTLRDFVSKFYDFFQNPMQLKSSQR